MSYKGFKNVIYIIKKLKNCLYKGIEKNKYKKCGNMI